MAYSLLLSRRSLSHRDGGLRDPLMISAAAGQGASALLQPTAGDVCCSPEEAACRLCFYERLRRECELRVSRSMTQVANLEARATDQQTSARKRGASFTGHGPCWYNTQTTVPPGHPMLSNRLTRMYRGSTPCFKHALSGSAQVVCQQQWVLHATLNHTERLVFHHKCHGQN